MTIKRALISVSDKSGILSFARFLYAENIEILSTGGTARLLREYGIPTKDIAEITQFPEMLDGRVKTLHPHIHGGILFIRRNDAHEKTISEHQIGPIDLVVVNLYPFSETVASGASEEECIENIDIGGPSLLRSAAKNFAAVTVVIDPEDLVRVQTEMREHHGTLLQTRKELAGKVFFKTALYDASIAQFFSPSLTPLFLRRSQELRYGENPHQTAVLLENLKSTGASLPHAKKIQGKELGYCNILDADAAVSLALEFSEPVAVIIKHATPCGVALGKTGEEAYSKALSADPLSAFGGIVAVNREISKDLAKKMNTHFLEVIIAPKISPEARAIFAEKEHLRVLEIQDWSSPSDTELRSVLGGFLEQTRDTAAPQTDMTHSADLSAEEQEDLRFAAIVAKHVRSNAIVLAKSGVTIGIGGGQTSRIASTKIALAAAGESARGALVASDGFFPFSDSIELFAHAGIRGIIQPGGSKKDEEVILAAKKAGIPMILTGIRSFRH